jgi:hypothetical protein
MRDPAARRCASASTRSNSGISPITGNDRLTGSGAVYHALRQWRWVIVWTFWAWARALPPSSPHVKQFPTRFRRCYFASDSESRHLTATSTCLGFIHHFRQRGVQVLALEIAVPDHTSWIENVNRR